MDHTNLNNEIKKSFDGAPKKADVVKDIGLINKYALRELMPDEVFAFAANLCDDQVDREQEAFSVKSLKKMQSLFIGKPLITDHAWSSKNQAGRIYRTELVRDGNATRLRASIYMIRTAGNEETINLIEGGILREVSVSCSMRRCACSACGEELHYSYISYKRECKSGHAVGDIVNGKAVHGVLEDPADAYEVSLVAVPAQPQAGITKGAVARREMPPEESEKRKKIFEDVNAIQITDEVWQLILSGKISAKAVADQEAAKKRNGGKPLPDHPGEKDSYGSIEYAILPGINDKAIERECLTALAFARNDLSLPPITIKYFVPVEDLPFFGLSKSDCKTFKNMPNVCGVIDVESSDRVFVRYLDNAAIMQKAVLHECYHVHQFMGCIGSIEATESRAHKYSDQKSQELWHTSKAELESLLFKELADISGLS